MCDEADLPLERWEKSSSAAIKTIWMSFSSGRPRKYSEVDIGTGIKELKRVEYNPGISVL